MLRGRGVDAADPDVIDDIQRRDSRLLGGLDRKPDQRVAAEQAARVIGRHIVLADMDAVGPRRERHVDAIVDDQRNGV